MKESYITTNPEQTQKMGDLLVKELRGGEIICLSGELGSGKTTFAQGALKGLGAVGPYTSPTFVVMKEYKIQSSAFSFVEQSSPNSSKPSFIQNIYHIDAYRINADDILDLGWEEIIANKNNIIIVEWAERIKSIILERAIWLKFEHLKEDQRKISIK